MYLSDPVQVDGKKIGRERSRAVRASYHHGVRSSTRTSGQEVPSCTAIDQGDLEQLRRVFRSIDILAYFKLTNTVWQLQVCPNDKAEKRKVVEPAYHISCDECGYICGGD